MPRKVYDDDELRRRALELRRRGFSYRQIAREIGCSVYKVHDLIAPYESPQSRLRQAAELATDVESLTVKVRELAERLEQLSLQANGIKQLKEVSDEVSALKGALTKRVPKELRDIRRQLREVSDAINWIRRSAERRLRNDRSGCRWLDKDGYCTL